MGSLSTQPEMNARFDFCGGFLDLNRSAVDSARIFGTTIAADRAAWQQSLGGREL